MHLLFTTLQGITSRSAGSNLGSTLHLLSEPTPEVYLWHGISIPYSLAWHSRHSAGDNKNTHNAMQARRGEGKGRGEPSRNWSPTTPALPAFWFHGEAGGRHQRFYGSTWSRPCRYAVALWRNKHIFKLNASEKHNKPCSQAEAGAGGVADR